MNDIQLANAIRVLASKVQELRTLNGRTNNIYKVGSKDFDRYEKDMRWCFNRRNMRKSLKAAIISKINYAINGCFKGK